MNTPNKNIKSIKTYAKASLNLPLLDTFQDNPQRSNIKNFISNLLSILDTTKPDPKTKLHDILEQVAHAINLTESNSTHDLSLLNTPFPPRNHVLWLARGQAFNTHDFSNIAEAYFNIAINPSITTSLRTKTINGLHEIGYKPFSSMLPNIILSEKNEEVRIAAASTQGRYTGSDILTALQSALMHDESEQVRLAAASSLTYEQFTENHISTLTKYLHNQNLPKKLDTCLSFTMAMHGVESAFDRLTIKIPELDRSNLLLISGQIRKYSIQLFNKIEPNKHKTLTKINQKCISSENSKHTITTESFQSNDRLLKGNNYSYVCKW